MVKVTSLFSGIGGSSTGYELAGFDVITSNEYNENIAKYYKLNHITTNCLVKPIQDIKDDELIECDVLDGSPPCQGFSTSGSRKASDKRNLLWLEYIRILDILNPSVILMENSAHILKGYGKIYIRAIIQEIKKRDYHITYGIINAVHYEVPQNRIRFILIGQQKHKYKFPEHHRIKLLSEAFQDMSENDIYYLDHFKHYNKTHKLMFLLQQGKRLDTITNGYGFDHYRLILNEPSRTLTATGLANGVFIHPIIDRPISVNEMKRLSSFPDDYILDNYKWAGFGIGNSVPPNMIKNIAKNFDI